MAQAYCLNYNQIVRGIAFAFPIPPQFRSMYEQSNELPHEFPVSEAARDTRRRACGGALTGARRAGSHRARSDAHVCV